MPGPRTGFGPPERSPAPPALTVLVILVIALSMAPAFLAFQAERVLFHPEPLLKALDDHQVYLHLPSLFAHYLFQEAGQNTPLLALLPPEQIEALLPLLLPESLLRSLTEQVISSLLNYLNGTATTLTFSTGAIKTHLAGLAGDQVLTAVTLHLPPCSLAQMLQIASAGLSGMTGSLPLCRPPDPVLPVLNAFLRSYLDQAIASLPDSITFSPSGQSATLLSILRQGRTLMRWGFVVPLSLLIVLAVSTAPRPAAWLTAWGWAFLLSGLLGLGWAAILVPLVRQITLSWLQPLQSVATDAAIQAFHAALVSLFPPLAHSLAIQSALLAGAGTLLIILGNGLSRSAPMIR